MFRVLGKILIGNVYCVSVEGDTALLKNGLKLIDENGNVFLIETIGMTHYHKVEDYKKFTELVLSGNVEEIGQILHLEKGK